LTLKKESQLVIYTLIIIIFNKYLVKKENEKKIFTFDSLLAPNILQKDVYDKTAKGVVEVI